MTTKDTTTAAAKNSGSVASDILREAADIVAGARNTAHGDKERSFKGIARLWAAYDTCKDPNYADTAVDVAWKMVLMKMARSLYGSPIRDHFVDAAGYAAIAGELALPEKGKAE